MKIIVNSIGINKISAIRLIRKYSGFSLKQANDFIESIPNSFMSRTAYEKIDELFVEFEEDGCAVEIETGYTKSASKKRLNIKKILFGGVEESNEKIQLKNIKEVFDFLRKRQDLKKAFISGVVAGIVMLFVFGTYFYANKDILNWKLFAWSANIIIGLSIGFSIRRRGKAVESIAGKYASAITIITSVLVRFSYDFIMTVRYSNIFNFYIDIESVFNTGFIISVVISAVSAYFIAWDTLTEAKAKKLVSLKNRNISEFVRKKIDAEKNEYSSILKPDSRTSEKTDREKRSEKLKS